MRGYYTEGFTTNLKIRNYIKENCHNVQITREALDEVNRYLTNHLKLFVSEVKTQGSKRLDLDGVLDAFAEMEKKW